jgi:monofunctional biosynthetic peptidoglycan transglycosylase
LFKRLLLGALLLFVAFLAYEWLTFPDVARLATEAPKTTAFMDQRREQLRAEGKDDTIHYTFVPYGRISPYLRRAVLVAEDDTFYEHHGVDVKGMQEAIEKDWQKKRLAHGGSTITQQLAKNLYLSPSRNPLRKLKEFFIARSLENHLTKKRILELYLNVVEMGESVYGAEAASHFYFQKRASELTPAQAALLAGCLPNPRVMDPAGPNRRLRSRQKMILSRMRRWGYLFEKEVLTEKKPEAPAPTTDTALQQTPATDTATPEPTATDTTATTDTTGTTATTATNSETTETPTTTAPSEPPSSQ